MKLIKDVWLLYAIFISNLVQKSFQLLSHDVGSAFDIEYSSRIIPKYATYNETMEWYNLLEARHPDIISLIDIGKTYEGRSQVVMRLSPRPIDDRPAIFIESCIHAREWLACASTNYVIHKMILRYKAGVQRYVNAMNKYIFYFMSISNPDGFDFTFNTTSMLNRFWRKNRQPNAGDCIGVDLNRNWDVDFGRYGVSPNPCDYTFMGNGPFSEPETHNMRRFMERTIGVGRLTLYLAIHSYRQVFLVPWSYTKAYPRNFREMKRAAMYAAAAIKNDTGGNYGVEHCARLLGEASGASDDWALMHMRANYSYTLECRPSKKAVGFDFKNGFSPSEYLIPLSGQEMLTSVMAFADTMNTR